MERYNFKTVESKWQKFWDENKSFKTLNPCNFLNLARTSPIV